MTFTVYSKNGCPHCTKVTQVLQLADLKFVEYKQDRDFTREEFISEFGETATYPRVITNEKILGGAAETVKFLKENDLV
jgi:glutaredoxin 3